MSKARITVAAGQTPAPSSQINTLISDYISTAKMVFSRQLLWDQAFNTNFNPSDFYWGWFPYHHQKSVYDTWLVEIIGYITVSSGGWVFQYSLDSGATWINLSTAPTTALPSSLSTPTQTSGARTGFIIDLSGLTSFQHLGLRMEAASPAGLTHLEYYVESWIYSTVDAPN